MKKHILIVEYKSDVIEKINQYLHNELFDLTIAGDAVVAKVLLAKKTFDLVISASMLPKSHGFTLAKYISENFANTKIIVICDKFESKEYQQEAFDCGACEIFEKPLKEVEFRQKVMVQLGLSQDALYGRHSGDSTRIHVLPLLEDLKSNSKLDKETPKDYFDDILKEVEDDSAQFEIKLD
jgi:DNA-binding response OmpR family regulator